MGLPGADGSIDLSDALSGGPAFGDREHDLVLAAESGSPEGFEALKTRLAGFLHGRQADYRLTMDPGYTYRGRFEVTEHQARMRSGTFRVRVSAEPYKLKARMAYRLNATGGRTYRFESGRKPVQPTVECAAPTVFQAPGGEPVRLPAGTWRLNDVVFREGWNELYVNSKVLLATSWADVGPGGGRASTWDGLAGTRWDGVHLEGGGGVGARAWDDLAGRAWEALAPETWGGLALRPEADADYTTYITYDWKDL